MSGDGQRIDAFIRRGIRAGFCDKNMPSVSDLVEEADDVLFERAMRVEVCGSTRTRGYTRPDPYPRVRVGYG